MSIMDRLSRSRWADIAQRSATNEFDCSWISIWKENHHRVAQVD
jgi:hypothetical protein